MTQPTPNQPQLPIGATVQPATTPDGQHIAQARILVGPAAYILELPGDAMEQLAQQLHAAATQTAATIRRANLGLLLPDGTGTVPPTNGHGHRG